MKKIIFALAIVLPTIGLVGCDRVEPGNVGIKVNKLGDDKGVGEVVGVGRYWTVLRWREQTTDDFRFCFKFPATISHQAALRHCDDLVTEFLTRMSPLAPRIGQYWLQLPATFGPRELPALWHFLDSLPGEFNYGVEVRHPQFFAKGEEEQTLNRGLHQRGVNRVIFIRHV